jgi:hypothetical protein
VKHGIQFRTKALANPEAPRVESVLTADLEADANDFTVSFILNLIEACCTNEAVPGIICRVLLNTIFSQIMD